MFSESPLDPRFQVPGPTAQEVEDWAQRESARRKAWLEGPTEDEQREWALRWRLKARVGLAESRLPASPQDVKRWVEQERARRKAWLEGPTEDEKRDWARRNLGRSGPELGAPPSAPAADEVEAWAKAENSRRRQWAEGPSSEEKQRWARRESAGPWGQWMEEGAAELVLPEVAQRFLREMELAGKGSFYALSHAPAIMWSYFVRAGRAFEQELYQQPRRGRVPF